MDATFNECAVGWWGLPGRQYGVSIHAFCMGCDCFMPGFFHFFRYFRCFLIAPKLISTVKTGWLLMCEAWGQAFLLIIVHMFYFGKGNFHWSTDCWEWCSKGGYGNRPLLQKPLRVIYSSGRELACQFLVKWMVHPAGRGRPSPLRLCWSVSMATTGVDTRPKRHSSRLAASIVWIRVLLILIW